VPHGKASDAADAWSEAIVRCSDDDSLATVLYQSAKASALAKRVPEALSRFEQVETRFPAHRLADDARLRAALIVMDQGDEARGLSMLSTLPDTYPDGDMRGEALFRVSLAQLEKHDLGGARATLDRLIAAVPDTPGSGVAGRAEYFRARAAELAADSNSAKSGYVALVERLPLSYYMLLAYSRLRSIDDLLARSTLEKAVKREPPGPFLTREHSELSSPALTRAMRLLEVGEMDAARREVSTAGLTADGVDPEVLWTIAWLYDRAGAPEWGHAFSRTRLVDFRSHWPAGRWRLAWEIAFPTPWESVVRRESDSAGIPAPLTWGVMREESAFDPAARSGANALGLMQLMGPTAKRVAADAGVPYDEQALQRPEISIALGARMLAALRASFPGNPALAIAAYNGGGVAVRRWLSERSADALDVFVERIGFDETRAYVRRVLASEAAYAYLYAPSALDELVTWGAGH
jgi:soluble lytic murein transglycosylase